LAVGGSSFGKNRERRVFASLFDDLLAFSNLSQGLRSFNIRAATLHVDGVHSVRQAADHGSAFKLNAGGEGRLDIPIEDEGVHPTDVV